MATSRPTRYNRVMSYAIILIILGIAAIRADYQNRKAATQ